MADVERRNEPTKRIALGLWVLAIPSVLTGLWAVLAPSSWYSDFFGGLAPPSAFGPYNEHFIQDLGSGYLGIGAILVAAALKPRRELVLGVLIGYLIFSIPHLTIHLVEGGELDRSGYLFVAGLLAFGVLVALWVWGLNARRPPAEG